MVKKTAMSEYDRTRKDGLIAINLKDGDELVNVRRVHPGDKVVLCSSDGKAILFDEAEARSMGRGTSGVRGITPARRNNACMEITNRASATSYYCEKGYGKRTAIF